MLICLLIVGLTNGLNAQIQVIDGDTFVLVPIEQIDRSYMIYLELDQIKDQYKADQVTNAAIKLELEKQISYCNGVVQEKNEIINKLENVKIPKINGVLGGGLGFGYNVIQKQINAPYIALNGGLIFKRKYIGMLQLGFNLQNEIVIGLQGGYYF